MEKVRLVLHKVKDPKNRKVILGALVVVLVGGIGLGIALKNNSQFKPNKTTTLTTQEQQKKKTDAMIATVDRQIALPKDEEPVLATVSDREQLQGQDFFKDAQNGDKILMYKKNKKAFLYRPSTKQVLAQAPLVFEEEPTASVAGEQDDSASNQTQPLPTLKPNGRILVQPQ